MEKKKKEVKTIITAFYQGGTKLRAGTTHTIDELRSIMENARKAMHDAVVDTSSDDETIADEKLMLTRNGLLFYQIAEPVKKESDIVIAPAGSIPTSATALVRS